MTASKELSLKRYNTLGVHARAGQKVTLATIEDLSGQTFNPETDLVLGDGSNVLLSSDIPGTVFLNRIKGRRILERTASKILIEVGAGESWHETVCWTLAEGWGGLENLSLIPGRTGAAPIQNIGAYGVEISSVLESVQAWDWQRRRLLEIPKSACEFGYRDSRFKSLEPDRFLITAVRMQLDVVFRPQLGYQGLEDELGGQPEISLTPKAVGDAVIRLRQRKLPDPDVVSNAGSFFKNPVISKKMATALRLAHPGVALHEMANGTVKCSAAWLIESSGWKGYRSGDAGISEQHALVLVNYGAASGSSLAALAADIQASVKQRFGIQLETEPRIINFDPQATAATDSRDRAPPR